MFRQRAKKPVTQQTNSQWSQLDSLLLELVKHTQVRDLLRTTGIWLNDTAGYALVVFYVYDPAMHELSQPVATGKLVPELTPQIKFGVNIYSEAARLRKAFYVPEVEREAYLTPVGDGIQSALVAPLLHQNTLLGVMGVQSKSETAFSDPERLFLSRVSDLLAPMIANAILFENSLQAISRFDRFQALAQRLTNRLDSNQLLKEIVDAAREMLDTQMSVLLDIMPDSDELRTVAWSGIDDETASLLKSRLKEDLKGLVAWARQPARTANLITDQRTALASQAVVAGMLSEMAVPVIYGEKLYGILAVETDVHRHFSDDEMNLLSALAAHAGVALRNAQLFERLQNSKQQIEDTNAELVISQQHAENARLTAVEANRLKTEFVNNMSHELRTPLNAVINFTRVVMDGHAGPVTPPQVQYLGFVHDSGQHLLGLINDILDLAKIEAGKMELRREVTALEPIFKGVMSTAIGLTRSKGLTLKQEIEPDLPKMNIDATRIRQVLLNMLSNAAKFTPEGEISLRAEKSTDSHVVVSVHDTGIGIKPEDLPKVFEEFRQIDGSLQRTETGTGLGMPISKRFIELHGGSMWIESEFGQGTTVYFRLPIEFNEAVESQSSDNYSPITHLNESD